MKKVLIFVLIILLVFLGFCRYKSKNIRKNHEKLIGIKIPKQSEIIE